LGYDLTKLYFLEGEMMGPIHEFYAVTRTSVYRVSDERDEKGFPIVEKVALKGESPVSVGERLKNGHSVGIMKTGIVLYDYWHKEHNRRPEMINTAHWGGETTPITGLFLRKKEAMKCLLAEDLQMCDKRWQQETEEVLRAIGDDHPVFVLSRSYAIVYS